MKKISTMIVGVFCALLLATSAFAEDTAVKASTNAPVAVTTVVVDSSANTWVLSLSGMGATTTIADSTTAFGLTVGLGKQFTETLPLVGAVSFEPGIRQSFSYVSGKDARVVCNGNYCIAYDKTDSSTLFSTKPYVDVTLVTLGPVSLYAGGNAGATYGNTPLRWTAAPEWGVNVKIAKNVLLDGRMDYAFDLNPTAQAQNILEYFVGIKLLF